jgi:hypothetical protein
VIASVGVVTASVGVVIASVGVVIASVGAHAYYPLQHMPAHTYLATPGLVSNAWSS